MPGALVKPRHLKRLSTTWPCGVIALPRHRLGRPSPERAYVFEIEAAYHRRPDWQRIFYNDIFLYFATFPSSKAGDYSDVKVVSPYGEIGWERLSRLSEEMKALMIDVVNHCYDLMRRTGVADATQRFLLFHSHQRGYQG
jgi:hypothetical protein